MQLKNKVNTSEAACSCGTWIDHWSNFSGEPVPAFCPVAKCYERKLVGAHVVKYNSTDGTTYIIPLCQTHNMDNGVLTLPDNTRLVSANPKETCDPPKRN